MALRQTDYMALPPEELADFFCVREEPVILLGDGIELLGKALLPSWGKGLYRPAASRLPGLQCGFWSRPWRKLPGILLR